MPACWRIRFIPSTIWTGLMSLSQSTFAIGPRRRIELHRTVELVRISALRSLKVRYRGSALGVLWSFANPVLMTAVYATVFGTAFSKYYDGSVLRYVLSAFVGLVVVTFFLGATTEALTSVVGNGTLLNKIAIPPSVFPLSAVAANVFQQAITTVPVLLVLAVFITRDPVRVALVPVVLITIAAMTAGFGFVLAALYVFFRDLPHLWGITGFILWLTSPLFYPVELAPVGVRAWFSINPVGIEISALREVVLRTGPLNLRAVLLAVAVSAIAAALGAAFFHVMRKDFMDLL
jgi:homopolymeric O-antigen transport system permease protein